MANIVTDTFTRADSSTSMGNADTGQAWSSLLGTWGISSGQSYPVSLGTLLSSNYAVAVIDSGVANCTIASDIIFQSNEGIIFRLTDNENFIVCRIGSGGLSLQTTVNVSPTVTRSYSFTPVVGQKYNLKIVTSGINILAYLDGVLRITTTETLYATNTKHGCRSFNSTLGRYDNFTVDAPITFNKSLTSSVILLANTTKSIVKKIASSSIFSSLISQLINKATLSNTTLSSVVPRLMSKAISSSATLLSVVSRLINKATSSSATVSSTVVKQTKKVMAPMVLISVTKLLNIYKIIQSLTLIVGNTARSIEKSINLSMTVSNSAMKLVNKISSSFINISNSFVNSLFSGVQVYYKTLIASSTTLGFVTRYISKSTSSLFIATGSLIRIIIKNITSVFNIINSFLTQIISVFKIYYKTFTSNILITNNLNMVISKIMTTNILLSVFLNKIFLKFITRVIKVINLLAEFSLEVNLLADIVNKNVYFQAESNTVVNLQAELAYPNIGLKAEINNLISLGGNIDVTIINQNFTMYSSETKNLVFTVTLPIGVINLVGATVNWSLFSRSSQFISKSNLDGGIVVSGNICTISLNSNDTGNLQGTYQHELIIIDASGNKSVCAVGSAIISRV